MKKTYEVAVIGGGIAGYSAALTLYSLKKEVLWLGERGFGEKLSSAEYIRNYPAVTGNGTEFAARLEEQRKREGVELTEGRADGVYAVGDSFLITVGERQYSAHAVILASGVSLTGNLSGEKEFLGRGVSYCAVCDGALYKGKKIAAILSSTRFAEEVEYLASFADTVYAVMRDESISFRAKNIIPIREKPFAIEGGIRVERLRFAQSELSVSGVFLLRNATPPSALVGGLEAEGAHVKVARDLSTNLAGLFAAGDVTGTPYQYVKAAGEGSVAAYSAVAYLNGKTKEKA